MAGALVALHGEVSVTVYSSEQSIAAGTDVENWLSSMSAEKKDKKEQDDLLHGMDTVLLKENMGIYVPFGCVHTVVPIASKRETVPDGEKKRKSKPGRSQKANETEYSTMLWIPHLSSQHVTEGKDLLCSFAAKMVAGSAWTTPTWEKAEAWKT